MLQRAQPYTTTYTRPVDLKKLDFIHKYLGEGRRCMGADRVLELGCGTGPIAMSLAAKGYKVKAVDAFPDVIAVARSHGLDAEVGDAATFNEGGPYDVVLLADVLTEVLVPQRLLTNAARNLKPRGLMILTLLNGYGLFEMKRNHLNARSHFRRNNALRKLLGYPPYVRADGERQQWFTRRQVLDMADAAGFKLIAEQNSDLIQTGSKVDIGLVDHLPSWMASGWYFAFRRQ